MKRLLSRALPVTALAAIAALAPSLPASAAAPVEPPKGLACADVVDGIAAFRDLSGSPTVRADAVLGAPACRAVTYTLLIFDEATSTSPLLTVAGTPTTNVEGRPVARFEAAVSHEDDDQTVCVAFETRIGRRLLDRAPDSGCVELVLDGAAPGLRFK